MNQNDGSIQVYEDELVYAIVPKKPAANGHVRVYPKKEFADLESMDDSLVEHIFSIANVISSALFEITQSHGTNIIANNGNTKGQKGFFIDIISRKTEDGLNFMWKPKQMDQSIIDDVSKAISDSILVNKSKSNAKAEIKPALPIQKIEADSYRLKQLNRRP